MSVQYVGGGGGLLGTLGNMAGLAGTFVPGAQWLTPLGFGMSVGDSLIRGDMQGAGLKALGKLAGDAFSNWVNPATGAIAQNSSQTANNWAQALSMSSDNPYNNINLWERAFRGY